VILLDTDILSLVFTAHSRVSQRMQVAPQSPDITIVTRIEVLRGRFESVLKAADADALLRAQDRLAAAEMDLAKYTIVPFDVAAGIEFDRLRQDKKIKKIGRRDLLIACIALARRATLVSRNVHDFQLVPGLRLENWAD
jgi:tRNA(fMet)-specific endonuclease VapC